MPGTTLYYYHGLRIDAPNHPQETPIGKSLPRSPTRYKKVSLGAGLMRKGSRMSCAGETWWAKHGGLGSDAGK